MILRWFGLAMLAIAALCVSPAFAQDHSHADHAGHLVEQAAAAPVNLKLPADEEGAKARLSSSDARRASALRPCIKRA